MVRLLGLLRDRTAATAIEYGLIAALIAASLVFALANTGSEFGNTMNVAESAMEDANSSA